MKLHKKTGPPPLSVLLENTDRGGEVHPITAPSSRRPAHSSVYTVGVELNGGDVLLSRHICFNVWGVLSGM